jgi:hypothetical protein
VQRLVQNLQNHKYDVRIWIGRALALAAADGLQSFTCLLELGAGAGSVVTVVTVMPVISVMPTGGPLFQILLQSVQLCFLIACGHFLDAM